MVKVSRGGGKSFVRHKVRKFIHKNGVLDMNTFNSVVATSFFLEMHKKNK